MKQQKNITEIRDTTQKEYLAELEDALCRGNHIHEMMGEMCVETVNRRYSVRSDDDTPLRVMVSGHAASRSTALPVTDAEYAAIRSAMLDLLDMQYLNPKVEQVPTGSYMLTADTLNDSTARQSQRLNDVEVRLVTTGKISPAALAQKYFGKKELTLGMLDNGENRELRQALWQREGLDMSELPRQELPPMLRQWTELKEKHPDAVLLFRVGDFYETYEKDAVTAAKILNLTLARSEKMRLPDGVPVEMAGFPYHALDYYLPKLIRSGKRVAICDQLEDPQMKKRVKRGMAEVMRQDGKETETVNNNIKPKQEREAIMAKKEKKEKKKEEQAQAAQTEQQETAQQAAPVKQKSEKQEMPQEKEQETTKTVAFTERTGKNGDTYYQAYGDNAHEVASLLGRDVKTRQDGTTYISLRPEDYEKAVAEMQEAGVTVTTEKAQAQQTATRAEGEQEGVAFVQRTGREGDTYYQVYGERAKDVAELLGKEPKVRNDGTAYMSLRPEEYGMAMAELKARGVAVHTEKAQPKAEEREQKGKQTLINGDTLDSAAVFKMSNNYPNSNVYGIKCSINGVAQDTKRLTKEERAMWFDKSINLKGLVELKYPAAMRKPTQTQEQMQRHAKSMSM